MRVLYAIDVSLVDAEDRVAYLQAWESVANRVAASLQAAIAAIADATEGLGLHPVPTVMRAAVSRVAGRQPPRE